MACELCDGEGGVLVWKDAHCRVVRAAEPGYPAFCRAIWNAHVKEMSDLDAAERDWFMHVVFAVEGVLREVCRPDKINLASLGNVTPHLHWHVIPRFRNDPHFPNAVWSAPLRPAPVASSDEDLLAAALVQRLSRL
jgi:diadenosine tetraphosphate (Ap4A) HIT family hydrolase